MTIYIKSPLIEDSPVYTHAGVQARYLELTTARGNPEILVIDNLINENGTHWLTGSSRLRIDDAITLTTEFPMIKYYKRFPASDQWTPKIEEPE